MTRIVSPLLRRIRSRFSGRPPLSELAAEIQVIGDARTDRRPAAISLPGQMGRVRAVQSETTEAYERARLSPGEFRHGPTRAFLLRDVLYLGGVLYAGRGRLPQMAAPERWVDFGPVRHLARAALPSSWVGSRYFGHHVVDDSATAVLAAQMAPAFRAPAPAVLGWSHAATYRARMGVDVPVLHKARIAEAWVFEDWSMTDHRRTRLETLRGRLRTGAGRRSGHGVFLRRRGAGTPRALLNEDAIERMLEGLGFEIVDLARDPADAIIERCCDAGVVVGVEGSGFAHGLMGCAPEAAFVVLQHPYRFNNVWKDYTDALGLRYAYLVGEGSPEAFRIDPADLAATLDLL